MYGFGFKDVNGSDVLHEGVTNFVYESHVDVIGGRPTSVDFPTMTEHSLVFRRHLGVVNGQYSIRWILCNPIRTGADISGYGLAAYDPAGSPMYVSTYEYVSVIDIHSFDKRDDVTRDLPVGSPGRFVYILDNTISSKYNHYVYSASGGTILYGYEFIGFYNGGPSDPSYTVGMRYGVPTSDPSGTGLWLVGNAPLVFAEFPI